MLKISVDGKQLKRDIGLRKSRVSNLQPPLRGFGYYLEQETEKQFNTETDPQGRPWAELKPSTLQQKRAKGYPDDILTATGEMRSTVYSVASKRSLEFGIRDPKARWHQYGTSKMPQRQIIGITPKRVSQGSKLIKVWILGRRR